jgi:hypothetical protein
MVALLLQSDCRLLQALPSICEIPALFNQEAIWLQEIENPQTIMCGSSCVSNHRNPSLRGEVLLMIPMECRRIVLFLNIQVNWHCSRIQLIPWQETPSNEGNTSIHYAKQDLLEQATEEQRFLNPQSLSVSSVEQGVATSQNLKDQSSEKHSSTPATSVVPDCSLIW